MQEYKALFVGDGFLPSLVEMKAKVEYSSCDSNYNAVFFLLKRCCTAATL